MKLLLKEKLISLVLIYGIIFIPMWLMFFVGRVIPVEHFLGIEPRTFQFKELFGIFFSWLAHYNLMHITNNSIMLLGLLCPVVIFERKPYHLLISLIGLSGFLTWLLGGNNTLHFGASGLVFAIFSYITASLLLNKRVEYLIPIAFFSLYYGVAYFTSFAQGLVPTQFISFAAHFGGLVSGIIVVLIQKKIKRQI